MFSICISDTIPLMRDLVFLHTLLLCFFVAASDIRADSQASIEADVVGVLDGDSIIVDAHPWPGMTIRINVRVQGIDSPEIRSRCGPEIKAAIIARDRMAELAQGSVLLENVRYGKYAGRVVADVISAKGAVAAIMLKEGLARPYDGGSRASWCD